MRRQSDRSEASSAMPARRLNWGCGDHVAPGWINSDVKQGEDVDLVADIKAGLPLASDCIDYAVSVHALPELPYPELVPALRELRRVLKPGGVLRLVLPDLDLAIDAYRRGDSDYFKVDPDEVQSLGGKLIVQMLWYGYSRSLFTGDFAAELLEKAGFEQVRPCRYRQTASAFAEIVALDNREDESLYVEARKPSARISHALPYNRGPMSGELEILDIAQAQGEGVKGKFRVHRSDDQKLEIIGWVLGLKSPATEVVVYSGSAEVGRTSVVLERPDVAKRFPDRPEAATAGFKLSMEAQGKGESQLSVWALLENEAQEPLGQIAVKSARRGFLAGLRRG
jgi:predicted SAM-dependent methyltransferase